MATISLAAQREGIAVILAILAVIVVLAVLLFLSKRRLVRQRQAADVQGWIKDQDLDGGGSRNYVNHNLGIMAKPDVLQITQEGKRRVIEMKSAHNYTNRPFHPDILQLTAEMMTTEAEEAELRYGNGKVFKFTMNDPLIQKTVQEVLRALSEMRRALAANKRPAARPLLPKNCNRCSSWAYCDFVPIAGHC